MISAMTAQQITSAEYFFDADPGPGNGTAVAIAAPSDTVNLQFSVAVTGLSPGIHYFCLRTKNSQGTWALQQSRLFYVNPALPPGQQIVQAEYFLDTDPGIGNGIPVAIAVPADTLAGQILAGISGLLPGIHYFCLRTKNILGTWSLQQSRLFYVNPPPPAPDQRVSQAEYFFDTDPGVGNGTAVLVPPGDTVNSSFKIPNPFNSGSHIFTLRARDADGNWSLQLAKSFQVCTNYGANSDFTSFVDRKTVYFNNISQYDTAYRWEFGDGMFTTTQRNPVHDYTLAGNYNVNLITVNNCATDTFTQVVAVNGIQSILPAISSDTNFYIGHVRGIGFAPGCTIRFVRGATTIHADTTIFISQTDLKVVHKFNHQPVGYYDVIAQNPSGVLDTLFRAFQLQAPRVSHLSMNHFGAAMARTGRPVKNRFEFTNEGNQTIFMLPVFLTIPDSADFLLEMSTAASHITNDPSTPPSIEALTPPDHMYPIPDPWNPGGPPLKLMPFVIPSIGPGETVSLDFSARAGTSGCRTVKVQAAPPLEDGYVNPLNQCNFLPTGLRCAMDLAGVIPGVGCITGAANFGCTIGNQVNDAIWGTNKTTWFDMVTSTAGMVLQCAAGSTALTAMQKGVKISAGIWSGAGGFGECQGNPSTSGPTWLDGFVPALAHTICYSNSYDPNAKVGPVGITADNYVNKRAPLTYQVLFENADTATAPAVEVHITDRIDTSKLDLSTFRFTSFGFGDSLYAVQEEFTNEFVSNIDLTNSHGIWLRVRGSLDMTTGALDMTFRSYDTTTYDLVTNPSMGFLPPNVIAPEGQGFISYSVYPKTTVLHGDVITGDSASIVFDNNAPLPTNAWINTIDTVKPSSLVQPLASTQGDTTFVIHLNGSDAHAGVMDYILYASINDSAFVPVALGLPYDSIHFTGTNGWQYEFFSQARDRVMNTEDTVHTADALTVIAVGVDELEPNTSVEVYPNPSPATLNIQIHAEKRAIWKAHLYTIEGKWCDTFELESNRKKTVSLTSLKSGLYYLKIENENKQFLVKKILVLN